MRNDLPDDLCSTTVSSLALSRFWFDRTTMLMKALSRGMSTLADTSSTAAGNIGDTDCVAGRRRFWKMVTSHRPASGRMKRDRIFLLTHI
jgi:hypothetical protein